MGHVTKPPMHSHPHMLLKRLRNRPRIVNVRAEFDPLADESAIRIYYISLSTRRDSYAAVETAVGILIGHCGPTLQTAELCQGHRESQSEF